ncbi:MAG: ORF6N domain-containing protein [Candidatus Omnitrophica bacterium]|nr:ORF6N domain-containing protein [Candidatus Omnitrophota bacterium]
MSTVLVPTEIIENKIFLIRGKKVMFDRDLAILYDIPTKRLKEQVNRNRKRFPDDFMFELTLAEAKGLRSQFATLKRGEHMKYRPYVFTEQGVAMLSSVINSERAIEVNIQIMRVFVKIKEFVLTHHDLAQKIDALERKFEEHDKKFVVVFEAIRRLMAPEPEPQKRKIGFHSK